MKFPRKFRVRPFLTETDTRVGTAEAGLVHPGRQGLVRRGVKLGEDLPWGSTQLLLAGGFSGMKDDKRREICRIILT